jgi:hypothetical protein
MNLADFLVSAPIETVKGMPMGDVRGFFLDLILSTEAAAIKITGQACDVENRTEAFFLTESAFNPSESWTGPDGKAAWQPEDLTSRWRGTSLEQLWMIPRVVKYYFNPEDRRRGLIAQGPFDSAAAMELRVQSGDADSRLVLYATPEYPCSIELVTAPERCDEIIAELKSFSPLGAQTTKVT